MIKLVVLDVDGTSIDRDNHFYDNIKTIMTKKQLRIPFKDGKPCKWIKDDHDEERDNYEFEECLEIHGFVRGCSSAVMILRPANDHGEDFNYAKSVYYQVFLTTYKYYEA